MAGRFKLRKRATEGSRLRGTVLGVRDVLRGRTVFDPATPGTFPPNADICETDDKKGFAKLKRRPGVG